LTPKGTARHRALTSAEAAGPPPPGWAASSLDAALRVVDEGPRPLYRAAIVSLAGTSVLAMAIAALIRPPGSLPGPQRDIIAGALATLCLSVVLGIASLAATGRDRPAAWLDRVLAPRERAAIWLALPPGSRSCLSS